MTLLDGDVTPAAVAVITSVPAHPLSRYDAVATPLTVATPALKNALPTLAQDEEKVTLWGVDTGTPFIDTVAETLVVPNADSAVVPTPSTGAVTVTAATPTAKPIDPDTRTVPACAVAVMVDAPAVCIVAGFNVTVATPRLSVKDVSAGVIVAKDASVLNVTTVLGIGAPDASCNVALTVAGLPIEMDDIALPAELIRASVSVGVLFADPGVLTENPTEPVTDVAPTWAVATSVPAPAALATFSLAVATPEASVNAVSAGVTVASVPSVLNVTTAPLTATPLASFRLARTVAGAPADIVEVAAPDESVSATVSVGVGVVPVPVPDPLPVEPVPPKSDGFPPPGLQPARIANRVATPRSADSAGATLAAPTFTHRQGFCTRNSPFRLIRSPPDQPIRKDVLLVNLIMAPGTSLRVSPRLMRRDYGDAGRRAGCKFLRRD